MNAALLPSMSYEEANDLEFAGPRADDYFFENLNDGRPHILGGHSQGSRLVSMVLSEYIVERPDRHARMIAAYRMDGGLTKECLAANRPHAKATEGADDPGV